MITNIRLKFIDDMYKVFSIYTIESSLERDIHRLTNEKASSFQRYSLLISHHRHISDSSIPGNYTLM